jgi:hypothetical protein
MFALVCLAGFSFSASGQAIQIQNVFISNEFRQNEAIFFTVEASGGAEVPIQTIEYAFDNDPGPGAGFAANVEGGLSVITTILDNETNLLPGDHFLIVRASDGIGNVSEPVITPFRILFDEPIPDLQRIYYAFDIDDPSNPDFIVINPAITPFENTINIPIPQDLALGDHRLFIRFEDTRGAWGTTYYSDFLLIPDIGPANADFDQNGVIDINDLLFFIQNFPCVGDCVADIDGDGIVDTADLLQLFVWYGEFYE